MKVLEQTSTKVSAGSRVRVKSSSCVRSTLDTKCGVMPPLHSWRSASHTSNGPKSEPPMPMLTTCLNCLPVTPRLAPRRTASANSDSFLRDARTSDWMAAPAGETGAQRRVQHRTALRAVDGVAAKTSRRCAPAGRRPAPGR